MTLKNMALIDKLTQQIMKEFTETEEAVTLEEAREMAEMELKEKANRRYEKSDTPRKKANRERKEDPIKREIISSVAKNLSRIVYEDSETDFFAENVIIFNPEKEITFTLKGENYSLSLIKHRPKK